jgi:GNAT superfamily N-acetyltransferase
MIRKATLNDSELIHELAIQFAENSVYKDFYSTLKLHELIISILDGYAHNSVIFLDEDTKSMLAGCTSPFLLGEGLIANELAWWVSPKYRSTGIGKELVLSFENWAKDQGCSFISMSCLDDNLGNFYEKQNYKLFERAYLKVLN